MLYYLLIQTNSTTMIKKIFIGLGVLLLAFILYVAYSIMNPVSPPMTAEFSDKGLDVKVMYGQPSKKGRLIFGEEKDGALQPYGKYWRLGANAATEITLSKNVTFAGKPLNAGTYRMYAVPGAPSFQIGLNSELGTFLAVSEPDYTLDVLKVEVPVQTAPETEKFTFSFSSDSVGINMDLAWDKTLVRVPIVPQ
jgi:hypothetical protein